MDTNARPRSLQFEREATRQAARGVMDPSAIIRHAEARASSLSGQYVSDPMLVAPRDRCRESIEEVVDARNHIVWWLEEEFDDERRHEILAALRLTLMLYDKLQALR